MATNLERIKAAFDHWSHSRGLDAAPWLELMDDDIIFVTSAGGREPFGPIDNSNRKAALRGYFDFFAKAMEMLEHQIEHYLEDDDLIIAIGKSRWRIRQTGRLYRSRTVNLFWFRDDKIIRYENCYDTAALMDASSEGAPAKARHSRHRDPV